MKEYLELPINLIKKISNEIKFWIKEAGSFFVVYFSEDYDYKPEDVAYTAIYYNNLFDLYFTKRGWYGDSDYIIAKKGTSVKDIYRELYPSDYETLVNYKEFLYTTFKVDDDANISKKALSKDEKLPSSMIIDGVKFSDDLDTKPEKYTSIYTTLNGKEIDFTDLNDVKNDITSVYQLPLTENEDFNDCVQTLVNRFGINEEEGEDIMINYYNISRPDNSNLIESNCLKQRYSYAGPIYRFGKLYKDYWEDYTYATSEKQALNNLTYKAKINNGYVKDVNLTLDSDCLSCDPELVDYVEDEPKNKYCDICGEKLNDGGTCPVCDEGEEDY